MNYDPVCRQSSQERKHSTGFVILLAVFLAAMASAVPLRAEPKWIRMRSPNFDVLSSAGERETRNTLKYFEQVREFFLKFNGHAPKESVPVSIVIFGSEKEYEPYKPNNFAVAYFYPVGDRDYIVMGRTGEQAEQVAIHEYTHLVAQHAGLRYPPWLNEGLAELFSTFTVMNDSIAIGDPIPGRIQALREDNWVPLSTIMGADMKSAYYNETGKAGSLYNEGWAAVHFLGTTKEYRPKFTTFLTAVSSGTPSVDAIQQVYGKSLSVFESELRGYIGQGAFNHLVGKIEIDKSKKDVAVEGASPFDVKIALTDIDPHGTPAAKRRVLETLKMENPKRPEPWEGLAYLDWEDSKTSEAIEEFSMAYALGSRSNRLLWDFGRLAQSSKPLESVQALKDLAKQEPTRVEVRIELAWSQYDAKQLNDAMATISGITLETQEQAPRFFSVLAYVQLGLGDRVAALRSADLLMHYAKTDEDRNQADRLKRYLDTSNTAASMREAGNITSANVETLDTQDVRPLLRRVTPPAVIVETRPTAALDAISGTLAEFICPEKGSTGFKFAIDTPEGTKLFSFVTPESFTIQGIEGGKKDFYCGKQEVKLRVKAEYRKSPEAGVEGVLQILTFEP